MRPPEPEWTVLYDADCGFCRWCLAVLLRADRHERLRPRALGTPAADALLADRTPEQQFAPWHLIDPAGPRSSAGAALAEVAALLPAGRALAPALRRIPRLTDAGYGWVAGHRTQLSRLVPAAAKRRADELIEARRRR